MALSVVDMAAVVEQRLEGPGVRSSAGRALLLAAGALGRATIVASAVAPWAGGAS